MMSEFERELKNLINRHSRENESNTPGFVLAAYLVECLRVFNEAIQAREKWYGRDPISVNPAPPPAARDHEEHEHDLLP